MPIFRRHVERWIVEHVQMWAYQIGKETERKGREKEKNGGGGEGRIFPSIGDPQPTRISAHWICPFLTAVRKGVSPFVYCLHQNKSTTKEKIIK